MFLRANRTRLSRPRRASRRLRGRGHGRGLYADILHARQGRLGVLLDPEEVRIEPGGGKDLRSHVFPRITTLFHSITFGFELLRGDVFVEEFESVVSHFCGLFFPLDAA